MKFHSVLAALVLPAAGLALSSAPSVSVQAPIDELSSLEPDQVERVSEKYGAPTWGPATRPPTFQSNIYNDVSPRAEETPTSSGSSSYDYSYEVALSGFNGLITHYFVSYSDPYVSGAVGVGHVDPTPTPTPVAVAGSNCNLKFPGLLSGIGLDLGLRLNLLLIGIDACVAL